MDTRTERRDRTGFNFDGVGVGDWFLGCPECWYRFEVGVAAKPICPNCRSDRMRVYTFTEEDLSPGSPDAAPR